MRRSLTLAFLTAALASVPLVPSVARADDAAVAEAKKRFDEGLELADTGKHEPARLKFQQAWSVFKAPAVLYNLARAEQLTGHELEALEHFKLFLKVAASDVKVTDAMRDKAKQNVSELAPKVGQVDIDVPPTARVTVDGKPLDEMPREPVPVQPGRHRIEATFEGKVKSVSVDCAAGGVTKAKIDFDAGGAITEPPHEGQESRGAGRVILPVVLGVAGLAGIGMGVGFASSSNSSRSDSEKLRRESPGLCSPPETAQCATYDSKRSDADSASTISAVGYIAGGVLLAGAVATFVFWPRPRERAGSSTQKGITAESLHPLIGNSTLGAGLEGRF